MITLEDENQVKRVFENTKSNLKQNPTANTLKLRHLLMVFFAIFSLAALIFGYFYFIGKRPLDSIGQSAPRTKPMFLYNIYEGKNKLAHPLAVAVARDGKTYISNNDQHTVEVVSASTRDRSSFGGQGSNPGQLLYPYGLGILPNGDVVAAETGNCRVQEYTAQGKYVRTLIGPQNSLGLVKPGPVYTDSRGHIYIGDLTGSQVFVLDQQGTPLWRIRHLPYPHGIAVDEKHNRLYISNAGESTVEIFALDKPDGPPVGALKTYLPKRRFSVIRGLAVDNQGRLYVADTVANTIRVFDKDQKYLFSFGRPGFGDGEFIYPNQIAVDQDGKIYITDWGNNRVQVWGY